MSSWYPKNGRVIFHIDMNCFYASVEMAENSNLKGKPLAIAGNPEERKGIVVTSSYEARAKGVKTTMTVWQARKLCPNMIVMRPNFDRYRRFSKDMFKILTSITPYVEPVSIDEGYMDVTDCESLGDPVTIAHQLQKQIKDELDLPCSIGIAPNKFLAKTASDMKKPMGITILRKRDISNMLWPLAVSEMYGVGEKTANKLKRIDIDTIGDLARADAYQLRQLLGINGERLKNRANGIDDRIVNPDAVNEFKSIGSSQTLSEDTTDETAIRNLLQQLAEKVNRRMKRKQVTGQSVQLMIRYDDRKTVTRSKKLRTYIESKEDILAIAFDLFHQHWNLEPIRLLGITVQDLEEKKDRIQQLDLFTYERAATKEPLYQTIDQLKQKYGDNVFQSIDHAGDESIDPETSFQKDFLDDFKR